MIFDAQKYLLNKAGNDTTVPIALGAIRAGQSGLKLVEIII